MSSLEVLKHARNVFSIIKGKTLKSKHKIAEIGIEIAIIVFAISLSLYLERWREEKDDHHTETRFLEGLRADLGTDLKELQLSSARCNAMKQAAGYFLRPAAKINWSADSINHYAYALFHNVYFFPNSNRYESLKSTGKLGVIADQGLQENIIDLYQTKIPDLQEQVNFFNDFMNGSVRNYLIQNFKRDSNNNVLFDKSFFISTQTKNILSFYGDLDDVQKRIQATIKTIAHIMAQLDEHPK
jgi:hypothetical protein